MSITLFKLGVVVVVAGTVGKPCCVLLFQVPWNSIAEFALTMAASSIITVLEGRRKSEKSSGSSKRGTKRKRETSNSSAGAGASRRGDRDSNDNEDSGDNRGGSRKGAGRQRKKEDAVPVTHDLARKSVCIGCLRNFGEHKRRQPHSARQITGGNPFVLKLCELLGGEFVYRSYNKRLPTYICSTCTTAALAAEAGDTIAVFQKTAAQR